MKKATKTEIAACKADVHHAITVRHIDAYGDQTLAELALADKLRGTHRELEHQSAAAILRLYKAIRAEVLGSHGQG